MKLLGCSLFSRCEGTVGKDIGDVIGGGIDGGRGGGNGAGNGAVSEVIIADGKDGGGGTTGLNALTFSPFFAFSCRLTCS